MGYWGAPSHCGVPATVGYRGAPSHCVGCAGFTLRGQHRTLWLFIWSILAMGVGCVANTQYSYGLWIVIYFHGMSVRRPAPPPPNPHAHFPPVLYHASCNLKGFNKLLLFIVIVLLLISYCGIMYPEPSKCNKKSQHLSMIIYFYHIVIVITVLLCFCFCLYHLCVLFATSYPFSSQCM